MHARREVLLKAKAINAMRTIEPMPPLSLAPLAFEILRTPLQPSGGSPVRAASWSTRGSTGAANLRQSAWAWGGRTSSALQIQVTQGPTDHFGGQYEAQHGNRQYEGALSPRWHMSEEEREAWGQPGAESAAFAYAPLAVGRSSGADGGSDTSCANFLTFGGFFFFGAAYVLFWEVFDNECVSGKSAGCSGGAGGGAAASVSFRAKHALLPSGGGRLALGNGRCHDASHPVTDPHDLAGFWLLLPNGSAAWPFTYLRSRIAEGKEV